jgi:hemoglobin
MDTRDELFPIADIERLVHAFYGRVRQDPELGPIFDRRIDDWPTHLGRMVGFWRAVLRGERTFTPAERGSPPVLHRNIAELELAHFERWLALFREVAETTFDARAAAEVTAAADRIALALSRHLTGRLPVAG